MQLKKDIKFWAHSSFLDLLFRLRIIGDLIIKGKTAEISSFAFVPGLSLPITLRNSQ